MGASRHIPVGHDRRWKAQVSLRPFPALLPPFIDNAREYDVSANPEDPVQTVSLVSKSRKNHSFAAEDPSSREVASFSLGKGKGDWAPFTVYALMRSGDVHSFCPFMPMNA
jgi:hypothetical protein